MPNRHRGMTGGDGLLQWLETFRTVAETKSLNRAAELLHVTQPAITRQIKALERELGAVLLRRTTQGVRLTPAGEAVLPHAIAALAAIQGARHAARAAAPDEPSRLRIAAGLTVTMYMIPPVIRRFRELWPDVEVDLRAGHHSQALDRLLAYEVDAAIVGWDLQRPGLTSTALLEDPVVLVGPADRELPEPCTLAEVARAPLLVLPSESGLRMEVDRALQTAPNLTARQSEYPTLETLKSAVQMGMGWALLPHSAVRAEVATGQLQARAVQDWPSPVRQVRLVVRSEGSVPEGVRRLARLFREHWAES